MSAESLPGDRGTRSGLSVSEKAVLDVPVAPGLSDGGLAGQCQALDAGLGSWGK